MVQQGRRVPAISASAIKEDFFPLLFLFFSLIIIFSRTKELSWNLKAYGCTEGRRRAAAYQRKGPKHGGVPSTPSGSLPQLLPPVRPFSFGKVDTAEPPESISCCTGQAVSETAVAGGKKELFCFFKQACWVSS